MAVKAQWLMDEMERWAPRYLAEDWDNTGLLVGDSEQTVERVLVALDATETVIAEAAANQADWIITHHPLIFTPLNRIVKQEPIGKKIITLLQNNIGLYSAHTNLDIAENGVNDLFFELLGLTGSEYLMKPAPDTIRALGRIGYLPQPMTLAALAAFIKKQLNANDIRFAGAADQMVHKIALCAGDASGLRYCRAAAEKECQVYVTGDLRHHNALDALEMGLSLIDASHFASEALIVPAIAKRLQQAAKQAGVTLSVICAAVEKPVFTPL